MTNPLVTISKLSKSYAGVNALRSVSLEIGAGEVRGLCGENGAGKSTLIKCLSGVTIPDSGEVHFDESKLPFGNVATAADHGIAVIHQESTVFPGLNRHREHLHRQRANHALGSVGQAFHEA